MLFCRKLGRILLIILLCIGIVLLLVFIDLVEPGIKIGIDLGRCLA